MFLKLTHFMIMVTSWEKEGNEIGEEYMEQINFTLKALFI